MFGADASDNELLLMETIHLFVELLDQYFSNVCEVTPFLMPLFICDFFPYLNMTLLLT